ncbi:hypothetical protein [Rhizobium leguminosarum]|uniref:hypothetical protein n=2 Tax=Rhizobium/Agrobacterium group TaxID=227290 RepID=UPI003F983A5A
MDLPEIVTKVVNLNNNRLVGKTRLQKTFYFLEELDAGFGLTFDYYHYGPYSEDLNIATQDAEALGLLNVDWKSTSAGTNYAIFYSKIRPEEEDIDKRRVKILQVLDQYDSISIELAATADYLEKNGYGSEAWLETEARKPEKASTDRIDRAKNILKELSRI